MAGARPISNTAIPAGSGVCTIPSVQGHSLVSALLNSAVNVWYAGGPENRPTKPVSVPPAGSSPAHIQVMKCG